MIHYYVISIFVQSVKMTCDSEFRMTEDGFDAQSTSEGPCVVPEGRQGKWGDGNDGNPSFQKQKLIRPKMTKGPVLRVLSDPKQAQAANVCQARWVSNLTTAEPPAVQRFRPSTIQGWSPHGTWSIPVMLWLDWWNPEETNKYLFVVVHDFDRHIPPWARDEARDTLLCCFP